MNYGGIKGTIITADANDKITITENGVIITDKAGVIQGVFAADALPPAYQNADIENFGSRIITTSFCDMHLHAPQYPMLGLGMDLPLMQWLYNYTFRTEAMFKDAGFAREVYSVLARELIARGTTHICAFSSVHADASLVLAEELERAGVYGFVGKISMDRNTTDELRETTEGALSEERRFIVEALSRFGGIRPIITPRFTPSCTDELMRELAKLQKTTELRVQSHLSENPSEVAWVKELVPAAKNYADAYAVFDMFGDKDHPAVMAHCIYSEDEMDLLKEHGVYVAHCPESNLNLSSGIAPVRKFLEEGIAVGLGSDVAGGSSLSMAKALTLAVQVSKMYWRLIDEKSKPLTFAEAFYLATAGGGSYFGKVGTFLDGYEFDAVVAEDHIAKDVREYTPIQRTERMMYDESTMTICAKYAAGCACEL